MFKHHSLKNQKRFLNFDFIFAIYIKYNAFSKKRSASYLKYLGRYSLQGMWLLECPKAPVLEKRVHGCEALLKSAAPNFILIFH